MTEIYLIDLAWIFQCRERSWVSGSYNWVLTAYFFLHLTDCWLLHSLQSTEESVTPPDQLTDHLQSVPGPRPRTAWLGRLRRTVAPLESQERAAQALLPAGRLLSDCTTSEWYFSNIFQYLVNITTSHNLTQQNMQIPGLTGAKQNSNVPGQASPHGEMSEDIQFYDYY